jgi:hypothetical protein
MLTFIQFIQLQEGKLNYTRVNLIDHIKSKGWISAGNSGGNSPHEKFIHPESRMHLSIPRSKTLSPGVISRTLKDAVRHEKDENFRKVA